MLSAWVSDTSTGVCPLTGQGLALGSALATEDDVISRPTSRTWLMMESFRTPIGGGILSETSLAMSGASAAVTRVPSGCRGVTLAPPRKADETMYSQPSPALGLSTNWPV